MSLIIITCSLCNKMLAWDSRYTKYMPVHWAETTGGLAECNGEEQKSTALVYNCEHFLEEE